MTNDLGQKIRAFIGDGSCLIVEPSASFSANLQTCLSDLGVPLSQISTARRFDEALRFIRDSKPKLLVTEYDVPPGSGLALVEAHEALFEEDGRISIVVTRNSSDSAVAQSAEGAVDAFILKPFSTDVFRTKINEVCERKLHPSPYESKLRDGRKLLLQKEIDPALALFLEAKTLETKPAMACYYAGSAFQARGESDEALKEYREGLAHHPLHYKCLIGEFEVLMERKDYAGAYVLIPQIRHNYPVTTQRLGQFLIAAVFTYHFDDLPDYYRLFVDSEARTPWLTELIGLALLTAGKYWLKRGDFSKALADVEMGITTQGKSLSYIAMATEEFLKFDALNEAEAVFAKILPADVGTPVHSQLKFKLDRKTLDAEALIERGRRMVAEGLATPDIFRILIELLAKAGKETLAESLISKAVESSPDLNLELYEILQKNLKSSTGA